MEEVVTRKRVKDLEAEIIQNKQEIVKIKKTARSKLDTKLNELFKGLRFIDYYVEEGPCVGFVKKCFIRIPTEKGQKTFCGYCYVKDIFRPYSFRITFTHDGNVYITGDLQKEKLDELTKNAVDWCRQSDAIFDLYNEYLQEID